MKPRDRHITFIYIQQKKKNVEKVNKKTVRKKTVRQYFNFNVQLTRKELQYLFKRVEQERAREREGLRVNA